MNKFTNCGKSLIYQQTSLSKLGY